MAEPLLPAPRPLRRDPRERIREWAAQCPAAEEEWRGVVARGDVDPDDALRRLRAWAVADIEISGDHGPAGRQ